MRDIIRTKINYLLFLFSTKAAAPAKNPAIGVAILSLLKIRLKIQSAAL
jgi:hypothetical protein